MILCNFKIVVHQRYWPIIFFFGSVFVWFWYQSDGSFIECLLEESEKIGTSSSLCVW